jgi:hypothetical protein
MLYAMRKRKNPFTGKVEDYPPPQTYLCPKGTRPDRQTISAAVGFPVPAPFADLVAWIFDEAKGDPYRCVEVFGERVGLGVADRSSRYESTPPELFPFGHTGVDGDHYGYLVHAPELQVDDYPVCHYCPMDSDGIIVKGVGTFDGLAFIISFWAKSELHPAGRKWAAAMKKTHRKRQAELDVEDAIPIPRDWHFQKSSDGVGVLAHKTLFSADGVTTLDRYGPVESYVCAAEGAIRQGHLATALYYLREGYWHRWTEHPMLLCELMCKVYERLGRECLAEVVRERMTKWGASV